MISEATIKNLETLRCACKDGALALVTARLAETKEFVAMVAAMQKEGTGVLVVPFGMLRGLPGEPPLVTSEGALTPTAKPRFEALKKHLKSAKHQAWFCDDAQGRPAVAMVPLGKEGTLETAVLTLNWGNPYELFEDPVPRK